MKQTSAGTIGKLFCVSISVLLFFFLFPGPANFIKGVQLVAHASSKTAKETERTGVDEETRKAEKTSEAAAQDAKQAAHSAKACPEGPVEEVKKGGQGNLFTRKTGALKALGWGAIKQELGHIAGQMALVFSPDVWAREIREIWSSSGFSVLTPILLFGIILLLVFRLRGYCSGLSQHPFWRTPPWRPAAMGLFYRSLPLLGTVLFLYACVGGRYAYFTLPLIQVVLHVLVIWLFSRWAGGFLKLRLQQGGIPSAKNVVVRLRVLVTLAMTFSMAYVVMGSMLGNDSTILFLGRLSFEVILVAWAASFAKALGQQPDQDPSTESRWFLSIKPFVVKFCYLIAVVGLLAELAGYGQLALYWYASWGRTAVVILWATLFFFLLHEWHSDFARSALSSEDGARISARPIKWLLIRLGWVAWIGALTAFLFIAWGARQTVLLHGVQILSRPIQIGSIRFSLVGFVYAFFILLMTRTAARFWRHILERKILVDSGLEAGVQESVTSITVYLLWAVGIVIALTALGFSTTSLTVALGALGVGLGFGLQNIFNNFVSGLILLFERPVQVGDAIEVNGTWGTISKIRVRSTVVQTYDNASLIIPNSDMISNQVTNWSFKDLRLRRWITVGVAYGSDTDLVRKTLLEIAHADRRALKRPRPDVVFRDFGDSALIFSLRVWTTIDDFIAMETDIRFAIDRLFRERNIEIAFPQRDIHIRSVSEEGKPLASLDQGADMARTDEAV